MLVRLKAPLIGLLEQGQATRPGTQVRLNAKLTAASRMQLQLEGSAVGAERRTPEVFAQRQYSTASKCQNAIPCKTLMGILS